MGLTASELGRKTALHALNRLGFGPRPGDVEAVLDRGIESYIDDQLEPRPDSGLAARMGRGPYMGLYSLLTAAGFVDITQKHPAARLIQHVEMRIIHRCLQ